MEMNYGLPVLGSSGDPAGIMLSRGFAHQEIRCLEDKVTVFGMARLRTGAPVKEVAEENGLDFNSLPTVVYLLGLECVFGSPPANTFSRYNLHLVGNVPDESGDYHRSYFSGLFYDLFNVESMIDPVGIKLGDLLKEKAQKG